MMLRKCVQFDGLAVSGDGIVDLVHGLQAQTEIIFRLHMLGIAPEHFFKSGNGQSELVLLIAHTPQVIAHFDVVGLHGEGSFQVACGAGLVAQQNIVQRDDLQIISARRLDLGCCREKIQGLGGFIFAKFDVRQQVRCFIGLRVAREIFRKCAGGIREALQTYE